MQIPIIDVYKDNSWQKLHEAFQTVGFVYCSIDAFSYESKDAKRTLAYAKEYFALPSEVKNSQAYKSTESNTGYQGMIESLTPGTPADLKEAFNWCEYGENNWLDAKQRMLCKDWCVSQLGLTNSILGMIEKAFGLEEFSLIFKHLESKSTTTRMLHYPPWDGEIQENQMRGGEHTDYGTITLLFTDGNPGLQIKPRGTDEWIDAPHIPNTFIVNVGDLLQRWTNDVYVSTPHRVVNEHLNTSRYSLAHFVHPQDDVEVNSLVGESKYDPISAKEYLVWRLNQSY